MARSVRIQNHLDEDLVEVGGFSMTLSPFFHDPEVFTEFSTAYQEFLKSLLILIDCRMLSKGLHGSACRPGDTICDPVAA